MILVKSQEVDFTFAHFIDDDPPRIERQFSRFARRTGHATAYVVRIGLVCDLYRVFLYVRPVNRIYENGMFDGESRLILDRPPSVCIHSPLVQRSLGRQTQLSVYRGIDHDIIVPVSPLGLYDYVFQFCRLYVLVRFHVPCKVIQI